MRKISYIAIFNNKPQEVYMWRVVIACCILACALVVSGTAQKAKYDTMPFDVQLSEAEYELYQMIMKVRKDKGLPSIPLSKALTFVAQTHSYDQTTYKFAIGCNLHSWTESTEWTGGCYTDDHKNAEIMWNKPQELTSYNGIGYEISSATGNKNISAKEALQIWLRSEGHAQVIFNQGQWESLQWQAIGIGIEGKYANVWFGEIPDKEGEPIIQHSSK